MLSHTLLKCSHTHYWKAIRSHTLLKSSHTHYWNALTHTTEKLSHTLLKCSYTHYWKSLTHTSEMCSYTQLKCSCIILWNKTVQWWIRALQLKRKAFLSVSTEGNRKSTPGSACAFTGFEVVLQPQCMFTWSSLFFTSKLYFLRWEAMKRI